MIICKRTGRQFKTLDEFKAIRGKKNGKFDLSGSVFRFSYFRDSDLRDSDLRNSDFRNSVFRNSDFRNSDLRNSDFRESVLINSDLSDSNLSDSDLSWVKLSESKLLGSNLNGTILSKEVLTKEKYEKMIQERLEFLEGLKKEQKEEIVDINCKWCIDFCSICEICPAYDVSMKGKCTDNRLDETRDNINETLPNASNEDINAHIENFKEISDAFMKDRFKGRDFIDLSNAG